MRRLALLAAAGVVYFIISMMALHFLRRDLSWVTKYVSDYAVGDYGSIERRELASAELIGVLRSTFGIALEAGEEARIRSIYDPDHEDGGLS